MTRDDYLWQGVKIPLFTSRFRKPRCSFQRFPLVWAAVAGASTDVPNVTVETTETVETVESTEQPTVIETAETDETTETVDTKPADDGKGNPGTGVALAVVPAVLAGAAIVVAKKRK